MGAYIFELDTKKHRGIADSKLLPKLKREKYSELLQQGISNEYDPYRLAEGSVDEISEIGLTLNGRKTVSGKLRLK